MLRKTLKFILVILILYALLLIRSEYLLGIPIKYPNTNRIIYVNSNQKILTPKDQVRIFNSKPDILIIQEWNGNNLHLEPWLKNNYHIAFEQADVFTFGQLVLSKIEIDFRKIDPSLCRNCPYPILLGQCKIGNQQFIISPVHFPPPVPFCDFATNSYTELLTENIRDEVKTNSVILIGDFNSTKLFGSVGKFKKHQLQDHSENLVFTWRPTLLLPAMLKIDHSFSNLPNAQSKRFKLKGLDHYGLVFDF